jgi:NTE family protein
LAVAAQFFSRKGQGTGVPVDRHVRFIVPRAAPQQTGCMSDIHTYQAISNRAMHVRWQERGAIRADREPGITLALGGGFSRGFAHLGVLEVLEHERLPISRIVGTSIGALLGAAYADGISLRDLCDLGRRVQIRDFLRFRPRGSYPGPQKKDCIGQFIEQWFRAGSLEELSIPVSMVATDLATGAPYVFTRGPIELAIRASCAFPGLVRPVEHEGHTLADGCIVAPVPTAIAAEDSDACIVGVNVASTEDDFASPEGALKVFDAKFRALRRSSADASWRRYADVVVEPQVRHIEWNDFSRVDEAVSAGAEAMRDALPALREILSSRLIVSPQSVPCGATQGATR